MKAENFSQGMFPRSSLRPEPSPPLSPALIGRCGKTESSDTPKNRYTVRLRDS